MLNVRESNVNEFGRRTTSTASNTEINLKVRENYRMPSPKTPAMTGSFHSRGVFAALERNRRDARGSVANRHDRLWQHRRRVLNTLVVVLFIFRLVFSKGRPGYATTLAELWGQCRQSAP